MKTSFLIFPILYLLFLAGVPAPAWGQQRIMYDSTFILPRQFDESQRRAYLQDEAYQYDRLKPDPNQEPGIWERALRRFWDFIFKERVGAYSLGDMIGYLLGIGLLIFVVFGLLKLPLGGIFDRRAKKMEPAFHLEEKGLVELDFEQLVAAALSEKAYKRAIRLLYLKTLKDLTLAGRIQWRLDKTNHDYLEELRGSAIYEDFEGLTLRYEYACYGDFPVDEARFRETESIFRNFRSQMGINA